MNQSRTLLGHRDSVYAIAFSSDGRRIASGSCDGTAIVWRTDTGEIEQQLHIGGHVIGLAFSSDGTLLAAGTPDGTVIVYDLDGKRLLCTLQTTALECLAFRPGTYELMVGGADGRIYGWEVPSSRPTRLDVASRAVLSLAFSQDGSILAAASGAGTLTFFDTDSWAIIRSYTPLRSEPIFYRVVLSPDGQLCLASLHYKARQDYNEINKILDRYEILVWELEREEQPALDATLVGHLGWIGGLDYAPRRDLIASSSFDETVQIWDRHEHDIVAELREHQGAVYGVVFSPDEEQLASCSADGTVQLWPMSALLERANLPKPAPEITLEAVRHRLLEAQRPGRSGLILVARDIVDRLTALRSRSAMERELNRLLSTPLLEGKKLIGEVHRILQVRTEQAYRANKQDAMQFYWELHEIVNAAVLEYFSELSALTTFVRLPPREPTAHSSHTALPSAYPPSASLEPPAGTPRHGMPLLEMLTQAMQASSSRASLLAEARTLTTSGHDLAASFGRLQAEAQAAKAGRVDPQSVLAGAEILWVYAERLHEPLALAKMKIAETLGVMSSLVGEHARAVEHFERAVECARTANDPYNISAALGNLGNAYRNVGRLQDAQRAYHDAVELAKSTDTADLQINHLINLSIVHADLGNTVAQDITLREARIQARAIRSDLQLAIIANQLGDLYKKLGEYEGAIDSFREALSIGQRLKDERLCAAASSNIGISLALLGRTREAMQYLNEALSVTEQIQAPDVAANVLIHLGQLQIEQGQPKEARQTLRRAIEITGRRSVPILHLGALTMLARLEECSDDLGAALSVLEEAVKVGERLRHEIRRPEEGPAIQTELAQMYFNLVRLNAQMGRAEEAFLASERGRAALLVRRLLERPGTVGSDAVEHVPDVRSLSGASVTAHLRRLGEKAVLVEYALIADTLYTFVIRADEGEVHCETRPIDTNRLRRLREDFKREIIEYPRRGYLGETWQELGELVVEPILEHLKDGDMLFLVPDGALHGLPLHALRAGDRRVIERWPVAYLPSASALPSLTEVSSGPPRHPFVLGIHFADEASEIMRLLNSDRGIIGASAPKEAVLEALTEADLIHISSYGLFSRGEPWRSGLVLQWSPQLEAYLSAREKQGFERTSRDLDALRFGDSASQASILSVTDLEALHLRASLVTLSACETGLATIDLSNDPVGLVSAFLTGGATAVLASLWRVDPDVTRHLMTRLYRYLQSGIGWGRKPQALRRAMLDVMGTHPHPYYWAAFTLVGGAALGVAEPEENDYA